MSCKSNGWNEWYYVVNNTNQNRTPVQRLTTPVYQKLPVCLTNPNNLCYGWTTLGTLALSGLHYFQKMSHDYEANSKYTCSWVPQLGEENMTRWQTYSRTTLHNWLFSQEGWTKIIEMCQNNHDTNTNQVKFVRRWDLSSIWPSIPRVRTLRFYCLSRCFLLNLMNIDVEVYICEVYTIQKEINIIWYIYIYMYVNIMFIH